MIMRSIWDGSTLASSAQLRITERSALNRDVKEWGEMFADPVLANATIDRIFDRAEIVTFKGQSYRLKGRIRGPGIDEIGGKE